MLTLMMTLALLQDLTKDDILRLVKDGKSSSEILQTIGARTFRLSAEDVVDLKIAGVGDVVLARMVAGPMAIVVGNRAHKPVRIRIREGVVEIGVGEELKPGKIIHLPGTGEFAVTVDGYSRLARVKTPAALTFRGCNLEKFEVVTLYIEGPEGVDTCLVESRNKEAPEPQVYYPQPSSRWVGRGPWDRTMDYVGRFPGRIFSGW